MKLERHFRDIQSAGVRAPHVGVLERAWLGRELGPRNHRVQRDLKALFDPAGILNPGEAI
jgi:FAD/FMN-containing dehydrogenase